MLLTITDKNNYHMKKNTIRDGGSTAQETAYTFDTVDMVYTVDTVQFTLLKLLYTAKRTACMPLYILLGNIRTLLDVTEERGAKCVSGWMEWSGYPLDCYDYQSTCGAKNAIYGEGE